MLQDPLWLCLADRSSGAAQGTARGAAQGAGRGAVLDAARLHCCGLARAGACRRACQRAFQDDWGVAGRGGPLQECVTRANESLLATCLQEGE